MPSTGQLMRARKRFAALLPDRATIQRPVNTPDGGGGFTQTWPVLAEDVPCRLSPVGGGENNDRADGGERISDEAEVIITFEASTDVANPDRLLIAGRLYDVLLVRRRGEFELTRRVEARELGPA